MILAAGTSIVSVLRQGASLPLPAGASEAVRAVASTESVTASSGLASSLRTNLEHPLSLLFIQLLVIIGASRVMGRVFAHLRQPSVVGAKAAGILLGPSLLGLLAPGAFSFVFPPASLDTLRLLSQIGVCLFMFSVGMEMDVKHVRTNAHAAIAVSHVSILFPYVLGVLLAFHLFTDLAAPLSPRIFTMLVIMALATTMLTGPLLTLFAKERQVTTDLEGFSRA